MSKSILDFTNIKKHSGAEFTQVKGRSGIILWCKPYTLTLSSKPTGVDTITCYRYSSVQPGAATGPSAVLTNGSTIYHGDVIYISATASSGYYDPTISSSTGTISNNKLTVDGNETITVTAGALATAAVYITAGTGVSSVFLSTNASATSGSASGSDFNIGSTVYGFAVLQTGYNPGSGWILVSGSTYRVGSRTVAVSGNDFGTQNGTVKTFTVSFSNPSGGYWGSVTPITNVPYGASVSVSGNTITINGTSRTLSPFSTENTTSYYYYVSTPNYTSQGLTIYSITDDVTFTGSMGSSNKTYAITLTVKREARGSSNGIVGARASVPSGFSQPNSWTIRTQHGSGSIKQNTIPFSSSNYTSVNCYWTDSVWFCDNEGYIRYSDVAINYNVSWYTLVTYYSNDPDDFSYGS